jgi:Glycosyltransferase WbsX
VGGHGGGDQKSLRSRSRATLSPPGFCYYHYWFNGRRLLEKPLEGVLAAGRPDFRFCLCWANEHRTRVWDGGDRELLMEQRYGQADDAAHMRSLLRVFADRRYIRVGGRPLFIVYSCRRGKWAEQGARTRVMLTARRP